MNCGILMPNELIKMHEYYVKTHSKWLSCKILKVWNSSVNDTVRKILLVLKATFPLGKGHVCWGPQWWSPLRYQQPRLQSLFKLNSHSENHEMGFFPALKAYSSFLAAGLFAELQKITFIRKFYFTDSKWFKAMKVIMPFSSFFR